MGVGLGDARPRLGAQAEGSAAGLRPEPRTHIGETDAHLGSTVVMLRG